MPGTLRIVLLAAEEQATALPETVRKHIDQIYICTKANPNDPVSGLSYASTYSAINREINSNTAVRGEAKNIHISTFYEFNTHLVGRLRKDFGLAGMSGEDYLPFRDKCLMKKMVASAGLRTPFFELLNLNMLEGKTKLYFQLLQKKYQLPFICKPIDAAASIGVYKIGSYNDFIDMQQEIKYTQLTYEVEEFIQGTLHHCDLVFQNGEVVFAACGEDTFPNFESSQGKICGSIILPANNVLRNKVINFTTACIKALKLQEGPVHAEIFYSDKGELVFLEVGARPPGMDICSVYKELFDVSLQTLSLEIELGLRLYLGKPADKYIIWAHIPTIPGEVCQLNEPEVLGNLDLEFRVKIGDLVESGVSYLGCMGKLRIADRSFLSLKKDFELIKHFEFVKMK